MANIRVNATRMELLRLRRRTVLAKKGHKLLKDKLDGLIKRMLDIAKEHEKVFVYLEKELGANFEKLILANSLIDPKLLDKACAYAKTGAKPILMPLELNQALLEFKEKLSSLIKLAQLNKALQQIAKQIIEIKRRVNALEYILIPELETAVRFIRMKLAEIERDNIVSLMKIKDIVRAR